MKMLTFDTETSGVDTDNDRILTCFMRAKDGDTVIFERNWILNPGVEIPEEASAVHGMTTQWIQENGREDVTTAIGEIHETLAEYGNAGYVVCGFNHSFDLAILEAENKRAYPGETWRRFGENVRYIDPCIFSRKFDRYAKGGHQLITVAKRNGLKIDESRLHSADFDVEVTEKLVPIMLNLAWKELGAKKQGWTPDEFIDKLQEWQREWKSEWAEGLTAYFKKIGKTEEDGSPIVVNGRFPW